MKRIQDSGFRIQAVQLAIPANQNIFLPETRILNPESSEIGGRKGPEPTRYGDYEKDGRCVDF